MIVIKNKEAIRRMKTAGSLLAEIFEELKSVVREGISTLDIDTYIADALKKRGMISATKGYMGYQHVCCVSVNQEVVHGVPHASHILVAGDLVKVDVCASWKGYCADMARPFVISEVPAKVASFIAVAQQSLDAGIAQACVGSRVGDISASVQKVVEAHDYGVVRDFAGHGIGKRMHEEPEILNYGKPGKGPELRSGMTFAIEPMITMGHYEVCIVDDGWTVETVDGSLAMHVEDTIVVTDNGPDIITRTAQV